MSELAAPGERPSVSLGGRDYPIIPLTMGLLKRIGIGAVRQTQQAFAGTPGVPTPTGTALPDKAVQERNWYDGAIEILSAALGKTPAEIEALPDVKLPEITTALRKIFELTGLVAVEAKAPATPGEETGAAGSDASTQE